MLCQERAPIVEVPTNLLLDRLSVKSENTDAFVRGDRGEQLVASRLAYTEFSEQGFELATRGDGLRQIADLTLDGLEGRSLPIDVACDCPRIEPGEHVIDNGHDDSWTEHVVGERLEHRVIDAVDRDLEPVPAHRRPALVVSVKTYVPTYHGDGRADWTFAVVITYKDAAALIGPSGEEEIQKRLYPDRARFLKEEQRRFEILDAHWDVPLNEVEFH